MTAAERLQYMNWRIAALKAESAQWYAAHPGADFIAAGCNHDHGLIMKQLRPLEAQRRIELGDLEPLSPRQQEHYPAYLNSLRWKRKRQRKLVSVVGRCEFPGCKAMASECHHLHCRTFGFEENEDLGALCRRHHEMRHGLR